MNDLLPYLKLFARHGWMMALGLLLAILTLATGIGLLSLSGWFISASAVAGITFGAAALTSFNYFTPSGGVRGFAMGRTLFRWLERVVTHDATFRILNRLRGWFWQQLSPMSPNALQRYRQADLLHRLVADIDALDHIYLRLITPIVAAFLISIALGITISYFSLTLALILVVIMLTMTLVLPIVFYRLGSPHGQTQTTRTAALRLSLVDFLQGQSELVLFNAATKHRQRVAEHESQMILAQFSLAHLNGIANGLIVLVSGWSSLLMLWLAADGLGSHTPPGPLLAWLVFLTLAAFESLMPLASAFLHLSGSISSAKRLNQIIHTAPAPHFSPDPELKVQLGQVQLNNIIFGYESQHPILNSLDLKLSVGEKVALLGKTGCGKSTLLGLLTRELQAQQGSILLDGRPIEHYSESALRQGIAVVPQQIHIFSATLRDNLRLACPDASDTQLLTQLKELKLDSLAQTPQGLDLWLGEGGRQLSGGEQRRLGIARALLHPAPLLLLDEPTEGVDTTTERNILEHLQQNRAQKTLLIITHRLSALELMDRICLMENGTIRTMGSHQHLMTHDPYYRLLHQRIGI